jgi:tRNA threonylcarbamoyl adenosine modification protein YjeE
MMRAVLPSTGSSFAVSLPNERALHRLVTDIASVIEPGDVITLSGDLGAGKTTFARALIRYLAGEPSIEVPSPTFTLLQNYQLPQFPLVHADFYRLSSGAELAELAFDDLPDEAVVLLEWPDRAEGLLAADRLDISFTLAPRRGRDHRDVLITGYGALAARAERLAAVRAFLDQVGYGDADRRRLKGDASTRSYDRLSMGGRSLILMNAPRRPDGPPVRDGRPYSAIAHLAEDVYPYVAIAAALRERGFSAPEIHMGDLDAGLLVLEDLGSDCIVEGDPPAPIEDRYAAAVDVLLALHRQKHLPDTLPVSPRVIYRIPRYDMEALLIEVELLLDWYLPRLNVPVPDATRADYVALWRKTLAPVIDTDLTWVLRDYHSPNLLWLGERVGIARLGLLDFQDAQIGPAAYDLASLLQDARVSIPEPMELDLFGRYAQARRAGDPDFDAGAFAGAYAALAAQRASKILGIFARLDRRDGKPQYLSHIPRVWTYLQRALARHQLAPLKAWYEVNVPAMEQL